MRRELVVNWSEEHWNIKAEIERKTENPFEVGDTGKGWSYVTFFSHGTTPSGVLFDLERLETVALDNGYFLPWEVLSQHNKLVVTAHTDMAGPSAQLFSLYMLLEAYASRFDSVKKFPELGFYGKMGGFFERPEKGRVLCIYGTSDDSLLLISEAMENLLKKWSLKGVRFDCHLSNGLSDIPRMLDGFNDPDYRAAGVNYFRITDPNRFAGLIEQARRDYGNYMFA